MGQFSNLTRRTFFKLCTAAVSLIAANPQALAQENAQTHRYRRTQLVNNKKRPITVADLKEGKNYVFHYPFVSTPCFLLNLGQVDIRPTQLQTEDGKQYDWLGGVGPHRAVVAFSAICSHRMTHPAQSVSFIRYRNGPALFRQTNDQTTERPQVIYCCSEKSVYDPIQGARVLGGPAPQPLAAILLEEDADGTLYATGTHGGEMFEKYFDKFSHRLTMEYGTTDLKKPTSNTTVVAPLEEHSRVLVTC